MLALYTESPAKALLNDKDLKIVGFIKEALELHEKGEIEVDQKKIGKAHNIINMIGHLKSQKKELLGLIEEEEKKKEYMQNIILPKVEKKKNRVAVKGAIPGSRNGVVVVRKTQREKK